VFGYALCVATAVQFAVILVQISYITLVLKVDFGNRLGYILLTCLIGCFTGVSFGAMIGAAVKKSEGIKTAVLIAVSMALSFLSGMMMIDLKYIIKERYPLLSFLNPSNLITDAFYSLYYFDSLNRYFVNISLLVVYSIIFYAVTYFILRRQKYASL
jgi:ABC-2 type transport system permease protein